MSIQNLIYTALKGFGMGAANVVPGVSGGTIALITGIYGNANVSAGLLGVALLAALYLVQTQADLSNAPVLRPRCVETTAMGAAYLAGLAVGYWADLDEIRQNWFIDREFTPDISPEERKQRVSGWKKAVACASGWAREV